MDALAAAAGMGRTEALRPTTADPFTKFALAPMTFGPFIRLESKKQSSISTTFVGHLIVELVAPAQSAKIRKRPGSRGATRKRIKSHPGGSSESPCRAGSRTATGGSGPTSCPFCDRMGASTKPSPRQCGPLLREERTLSGPQSPGGSHKLC